MNKFSDLLGLGGIGGYGFNPQDYAGMQNVIAQVPQRFSGTVDDWVSSGNHKAEFGLRDPYIDSKLSGKFKCSLCCWHLGNHVSATGAADTSGDAFLNAVEQIEKTIGTAWRAK